MANLGKHGLWGLNPFFRCQLQRHRFGEASPNFQTHQLDPSLSALLILYNETFQQLSQLGLVCSCKPCDIGGRSAYISWGHVLCLAHNRESRNQW